ncbi:hypothetical protein B0H11DRAFT_1931200 [Mycena galericulata]|nr:hypothetical protein B0H11DRAFT_1931200 [Mycena galericulata]
MQVLHDALQAEKDFRAAGLNTLGRVDAPGPGAASPALGDETPRGATRPHSEIEEDDNDRFAEDHPAPYTLEEGRAFKRHKNLTAQADADADMFLKTSNPMRHMFQMYIVGLECRDALQIIKTDQGKKYKVEDTLAKTCTDYAGIGMLSHRNKNYRNRKDGRSIQSSILDAMRTLQVKDLPPAMETGRCDVVLKYIGKALTDKRFLIKKQIFASLNGKEKVDIAKLTRLCISASPARPTLPMYQRIAFLRSIAVQFKKDGVKDTAGKPGTDDAGDSFWNAVDNKLAKYHKSYPIKEDRQLSRGAPAPARHVHFAFLAQIDLGKKLTEHIEWGFNFNASALNYKELQHLPKNAKMWEKHYREDLAENGLPDASIPITEARNLDVWLKTLNDAMA